MYGPDEEYQPNGDESDRTVPYGQHQTMIINFVSFWALLTFAISRGDLMGMALATLGFLFMHTLIEEYYEAN